MTAGEVAPAGDGEGAGALADPPVIALAGVEKSFAVPAAARRVLAGVDLTVAAGDVVAVAGRSGSGKTTLLTIVAGWEEADAGTVAVLGSPAPNQRPWRDLAVLPQSLGMLDELTVAENVTLPLRLDDVPGARDPGELMARLGIDHLAGRYPDEVSLGEQQRAALARAAVAGPRVLVADEPIAHQNEAWAERMLAVVADLATGGTACLMATHNPVAFGVAHRALELHDGRLRPLAR